MLSLPTIYKKVIYLTRNLYREIHFLFYNRSKRPKIGNEPLMLLMGYQTNSLKLKTMITLLKLRRTSLINLLLAPFHLCLLHPIQIIVKSCKIAERKNIDYHTSLSLSTQFSINYLT